MLVSAIRKAKRTSEQSSRVGGKMKKQDIVKTLEEAKNSIFSAKMRSQKALFFRYLDSSLKYTKKASFMLIYTKFISKN